MPNTVKTALLLGAMSALFLFLGDLLGGAQGLMLGFVVAVATNLGSYWFSDKIVLRLYSAQEVGPEHRLSQIVAKLAARALPMPRTRLHHPAAIAQRVRDRPQPATRRGRRHGGSANPLRRGARGRARSRIGAREAYRDILISSVAATLAAAIDGVWFAMFWGVATARRRDDDRGGSNPSGVAGDHDPGARLPRC
jgi:heat shock protein HtpX